MKIISHRGNLSGIDLNRENKKWAINECLLLNFDVEIDVHYEKNEIFLGHDSPEEKIDIEYLIKNKNKLWLHLKNIDSVCFFLKNKIKFNWFWHQKDDLTLTSFGIPWCYPDKYIECGVTVVKNIKKEIPKVYGICTDYPLEWRKYNEF